MYFWDKQLLRGSQVAVVDNDGKNISYDELNERVELASECLLSIGRRCLGFIQLNNTDGGLVAYLASLRARHVPLLIPNNLSPSLYDKLTEVYSPDWHVSDQHKGSVLPGSGLFISLMSKSPSLSSVLLHRDLGLLLSTSGSTGSPKLVRLSYEAINANATSIVSYLGISPSERALTVLPPYYSYGLSIINSHLLAGASIVCRDVSVMSPDFVRVLREEKVTSISGVPYIYQMLNRTGFETAELPNLRTLTQAGGKLDEKLTRRFAEISREKGWRFFVMYGQTEATARISYVPDNRILDKIGSIGVAIPDGRLEIDTHNSELIYMGPNVMMGYAIKRADLALGDELAGILRTGDLAVKDEDGFFYVTGRMKRFIKLAGNRYSLDEIEEMLQTDQGLIVAIGGRDERLIAWIESTDETLVSKIKIWFHNRYGLHHSLLRIKVVKQLPLLPTGKKDYQALLEDA